MNRGKIFLTREEQLYLMEMLEMDDPAQAAEKFALLMVREHADPTELVKYLKRIMKVKK